MEVSAPAKIILFGEHAVVYKQPALAVPLSSIRAYARIEPAEGFKIVAQDTNEAHSFELETTGVENALILMARLTLEYLKAPPPHTTIFLRSDIPLASGFGSGAAVSAALGRAIASAVGQSIDNESLNTLVYRVEQLHHGTPSGIDNTVIVHEKPVYFVRGERLDLLKIGRRFKLVVADTGIKAHTHVSVGDVRRLFEQDPARIQPVFDEIGEIARTARRALEAGEIDLLGDLMNRNHSLLKALTVSSPELDHLVYSARAVGAVGAKLSGGGRGGNMIALPRQGDEELLANALLKAGAVRVYVTEIG